jgi:hypothetical protein
MTSLTKAVVLFTALAIAATVAISQELELALLPATPSPERLQAVASLSPFAEPIPSGMARDEAKQSIRVFTRQGRWPILVEYEDGSKYWGEISEIGPSTFKLLNRKTTQEATLSYAGIRSIGIAKDYGVANEYALPRRAERRRLPRPPVVLTPEETGYKLAVQKLGVDEQRFVHCDLPKGKVRTGAITAIREDGFVLKDGIFATHWIAYTDLKATPRPVAAVGTKIAQGFKLTGLVVVTIPLLPFAFLFWDGC